MSRAVTPFEQTKLTLQQFSYRRAAVIHRNIRALRGAHFSAEGWHKPPFFLCHLGAPCVTATIKITEAAKRNLPKGVWVSKEALLDRVSTGCGRLRAGRRARQLWVGQCQLWSFAALMESSVFTTEHNFSKGAGNARPWVHQTFTELGKLLWKNLIQSDLAPPVLTGLPSSPSCALTRCSWLLSTGISDSWVGYPAQHKFLTNVLANRKKNCLQLKDG